MTTPDKELLDDPLLAIQANVLDDLEELRIGTANRVRILTRNEPDKDGEERGFGLDLTHPMVARLHAVNETLEKLEHDVILQLNRMMRKHPLYPWIKSQKGLGERQVARLLSEIGDPYWHTLDNRPRTVSELWAYCGLHVLPAGHPGTAETHRVYASEDQTSVGQAHLDAQVQDAGKNSGRGHDDLENHNASAPSGHTHSSEKEAGDHHNPVNHNPPVLGQTTTGAHKADAGDHRPNDAQASTVPGVAPRRKRGEVANWSTEAKTRAILIAMSCIKTDGYFREVYSKRREHTKERKHQVPCTPCGTKGKPATVGTDWRDGHKHADALRVTAKAVLKGLWIQARNIHEDIQDE